MLFIYLIRKFLVMIFITSLIPSMALAAQILTYTDHEPLGGMRTRFINDVFFSAIERESNGRLKIEAHWGSEIATGYKALGVIGEGHSADMGIVVPEYVSHALPLHQIFKSFPIGPAGDKQIAFFRQVYSDIPDFPAELQKEKVINLFFATGFPVAFLSSEPLNTLDDINGGKWRSASFWHQDFLRNAGAIPVTMPWGEGVYKALKDGSLNGLMVNMDSGYDINAHEAAPNVVVSRDLWLGHVYLLVINENTWNRLAKEDREAIQRAAESAYKTLGSVMDNSFNGMVAEMQKKGVKIRILASKEVWQWEAASRYQDVQASWEKEQEGKDIKNVRSVLEKVRSIMNDSVK